MDLIRTITAEQMKRNLPPIKTGDTVKVSAKVVEGNRERIQVFEGTVMRLRGGGLGLTITVRRIASGVGVERTFKVHSPRIEKIEIVRHGVSHRAQLYFLRDRVGKQSSLRERRGEVGEVLNPVSAEPDAPSEVEAVGASTADETSPVNHESAVASAAPGVASASPVDEFEPAAPGAPDTDGAPAQEVADAPSEQSEQAKA